MYKSYFKIGWRNLLKNKGYSFINIGGLAVGMAVAMLIGLWVYDELQFNKYHKNYPGIARVLRNGTANGETFTNPHLPIPLAEELRNKHGHLFKHVVMVIAAGDHIISTGDRKLSMRGPFMEKGGPEMFTLKIVKGSTTGFFDPHSILLSESTAQILFGSEDPINKVLRMDTKIDVKVTGVYEDLPYNSEFYGADFIAPWQQFASMNEWVKYQDFESNMFHVYVQIANGTDFESASRQIKDAVLRNVHKDRGYITINPQLFLHPMKDWHLHSEWKNGVNTGGLIQTVWLFGIVGVFVLLLACINFMNLSTARSEKRAREVGIRKSMGSIRTQLINQFFSESFLVVILAFVFAFIIVLSSLNWFNVMAGKQMQMPWTNIYFWLGSLAFIFITGFLAGSYPALYLSSFNPVRVLKGSLRAGRYASIPRKVLVVIQFTVSVTLIIGTIIVYEQIQFAKNRPVGYDRSGLLMIQMTSPDFYGKYEVLRTELKKTGAVAEMAESSSPTTDIWNSNGGFNWKGKNPDFILECATYTVTPEYGKTVGWQFVQGRDFSRDLASDSAGFVINEALAKVLGFENPVGEVIEWTAGYRSRFGSFTVLGVIKDMVVKSPYAPPVPSVFLLGPTGTNWINIRINPEVSTQDALAEIDGVFRKIIPSVPFDYKFADEEYATKFVAEERIGKLASVFAVLAIIISCLGLFGLASFVAEQRTKEIGIRKVVGASVFNLWKMLSKDFVVLVVISCLIAVPLSYYFLGEWLNKYEYRTEISWWIFALTSVTALVITLSTVSYQAIKAALMNPVKSLRSE
jgi:ABC-type antimicrobial peptide transport system permease subunit